MIYHIVFGDQEGHRNKRIAFLVPVKDFNSKKLEEHYIRPLVKSGLDERDFIAINLMHKKGNKVSAVEGRKYLEQVYDLIQALGVDIVVCTDAQYFKLLTKVTKPTATLGYPTPCMWEGIDCFYLPSLGTIFYNPDTVKGIELGLMAVSASCQGRATAMEKLSIDGLVKRYWKLQDIEDALKSLHTAPVLAIDIETFSLRVGEAGLGSIGFAPGENTAIAFMVDLRNDEESNLIRIMIKTFLEKYITNGGRILAHKSTFDMKMLIWELFMDDVDDIPGMRKGLNLLFSSLDDTRILAYLALNNTNKANLGLKALAFEFAGNYAVDDIKDITKIPVNELLVYNGIDVLATQYVFNKYREQVRQEQEHVYQTVFLPSLKVNTMMELTGLPLNLNQVLQTEADMELVRDTALEAIKKTPLIEAFTWKLREDEATRANAKLVKLRKTKDDYLNFEFNPNSGVQLRKLLYDYLGMPIRQTTDKGNPSTSSKALNEMFASFPEEGISSKQEEIRQLIGAIMDLHEVSTILSTFIPAFKNKSLNKKGWTYLLGNFNLGGTVSGRLSSSDPNLQNIPSSGTKYAKAIKKCIQAPKGWLFVGADYFSLEDRISALQTKDPNKLKVYTDGYDGHCLRAYSYFHDRMPDIMQEMSSASEEEQVLIINSIEERYPKLRQLSKGPTFALTYMGTWKTLVETFGLTKEEAIQIEANYHNLYQVSDEWVQEQLVKAQTTGYVELAFGLRLRTPMLPRVILTADHSMLPYEAYSEIKTAANALGQSYGLLNSFAGNMFMERVWNSPYADWILPVAQIHDSQYYMIRNHLGCLHWVNENLVECMEWNDLEAIKHDEVGLGSQLEVYWPTWADPIKIPNRISMRDLKEQLDAIQPPPKPII